MASVRDKQVWSDRSMKSETLNYDRPNINQQTDMMALREVSLQTYIYDI